MRRLCLSMFPCVFYHTPFPGVSFSLRILLLFLLLLLGTPLLLSSSRFSSAVLSMFLLNACLSFDFPLLLTSQVRSCLSLVLGLLSLALCTFLVLDVTCPCSERQIPVCLPFRHCLPSYHPISSYFLTITCLLEVDHARGYSRWR